MCGADTRQHIPPEEPARGVTGEVLEPTHPHAQPERERDQPPEASQQAIRGPGLR